MTPILLAVLMRPVSHVTKLPILSKEDPPAAILVNASGNGAHLFVCEHASAAIPSSLGDLGLDADDRLSHAVWDIGAKDLALELSRRFDARLVLGGISRLVYDCNRPPEREDATPAKTEEVVVPGNRSISAEERAARVEEVYDTFHNVLDQEIGAFMNAPVLVTVHSFSPRWHGVPRPTEIGLLHDEDDTLAVAMHASKNGEFRIELNMPYSAADGVTHLLARHAVARNLRNVMIEVRNDLLGTPDQIRRVADALETMLVAALSYEVVAT